MAMLMLASRSHTPAAIHKVVECGMNSSASEVKYGACDEIRRRRLRKFQVRSDM